MKKNTSVDLTFTHQNLAFYLSLNAYIPIYCHSAFASIIYLSALYKYAYYIKVACQYPHYKEFSLCSTLYRSIANL